MSVAQLPRRLAAKLVRGYQIAISPWLGSNCRFQPTCSQYALEAIELYGLLKGGYLSCRRIIKCHPFHPGGLDCVPPKTLCNHPQRDDAHQTLAPRRQHNPKEESR